jgi:histidine triad (HIT) family protein
MTMDCLFCKIAQQQIPATIIYQDEHVVAFRDISPQAPVHALVIPRRHITTLNDLQPTDADLLGRMIIAAQQIAAQDGIAESGFRLAMNCNSDGGQTVYHIHLHVLGGRAMHWPPG